MEESATRTKALTGWRPPFRHGPKAVQALRMTTSSLAAFALAQALALPQGFWAVITALIVTQSNVGGSLKAALDRFIGSVFGAVYGSAVAFAIPHEHGLSRAAALIVAVAPLSFLAARSAGFRVAPITAIIVLLSATGSPLGPFCFAVDRVLEVGLGCAVGLLVSVLIRTETKSPTAQPSPTSRTRSTAKQNGPRGEPVALSSTMMAVIGATRKPAERAARNERGATATIRAAARDSPCSCGIAKATALPYTAPNTEPMNRSSAALSEPPTLLWVTIKAVITAQKPCGSARAWAKAKAPKLDTVIRRACTAFGPWRKGNRQPINDLVLAARPAPPACK